MKQPYFTKDAMEDFGPLFAHRQLQKTHDIKLRVARNLDTRLPVEERAKAWIEKHPQAETLFERFTFQALNAGRKRFGAKAVAEQVRWQSWIEGADYRLNNIAVSLLARRFMQKWPQYGKVFETREKA